jgi:hypothetical protein
MVEQPGQLAEVRLDADVTDQQPEVFEQRQEVVLVRSLDKGVPFVGAVGPAKKGADRGAQASEVAAWRVGESRPGVQSNRPWSGERQHPHH